jgi:hypothetical protein
MTSPSPATTKKRLSVLARAKTAPGFVLTDRDRQIVEAVYRYRALTREQVERLFFHRKTSHPEPSTLCQHRLKVLYHAGYLDRGFQARTPVEGLKPLIYFLDRAGADLLAQTWDVERADIDWDKRDNNPSWWFLSHLLATNDARIAITLSAARHGWQLLEWRDDRTLKREKPDKVQVEWVDEKKKKHNVRLSLVPDGYLLLESGELNPTTNRPKRHHRFLEMDMGTVPGESSRDARHSWSLKSRAYIQYYRSGAYERDYQAKGLRVLTVTTTPKRLENLLRATQTAGGRELFLFSTLDEIRSADPLADPIWQQPGSAERFRAL